MREIKRIVVLGLMWAGGCGGGDGGADPQSPEPDTGGIADGGTPDQGPPDEIFAYNFLSMWGQSTVERRIHANGSESLHGETLFDLSLEIPVVLRVIEDAHLDAQGVLTAADIHVWNTLGNVESEKRVVLDPAAGEVRITRPAGSYVWQVPGDAPWVYYHLLSDVFLGYQTASPVAAWVNARATEASETVRGLNYDALFAEPIASADLYQGETLLIGADAIQLDEEFVLNIALGQLGDFMYRTNEGLGDLLDFSVPEGSDAMDTPDCTLPGTAEDFAIASADGTTIAGEVDLPPGAAGPIPFVVLNFGTGGCDRDCTMVGPVVPRMACLARPFLQAGIGVVRYDDRGHGESGGDLMTVTFHQRSDDATAVAAMVGARADADPDALFLLGWSEGVAHASVAASRVAEVDGLLFMAGVGENFGEVMVDQGDVYLGSYGMPQPFIDMVHNYRQIFVNQILAGTFGGPTGLSKEYFRQAFSSDGGVLAEAGARPAAIFQGRDDWQVPEQNAGLLEAALLGAGVTDVTVHVYDDVGHKFVSTAPGFPSGEEYSLPLGFDTAFLADLVDWVDARR